MAGQGRITTGEHVRRALEFLEHSDREFAAGQQQQGSEKLWGAVCQVAFAVAKQRGLPHGKSSHRRRAVRELSREYDEPLIARDYGLAEKFHANFYHDFMEDDEIDDNRPMVREFVHRLIEIVESQD